MKILIACEESQEVCKAFRARGHEAYSCDIQECSGGHPEWHITGDVVKIINPKINWLPGEIYGDGIAFFTSDGKHHFIERGWDMIIAHPPCTYLTVAGAANIPKQPWRIEEGYKAKDFFLNIMNAQCDKIIIENPPPMKRFNLPRYTQLVRPWMFGNPNNKPICLWIQGVKPLKPTNIVERDREMVIWTHKATGKKKSCSKWYNTNTHIHSKHRSKTFPEVAQAMAEQWG